MYSLLILKKAEINFKKSLHNVYILDIILFVVKRQQVIMAHWSSG